MAAAAKTAGRTESRLACQRLVAGDEIACPTSPTDWVRTVGAGRRRQRPRAPPER